MDTLNPKYRYGNRETLSTLADFDLMKAARPVLYREREILRKRNARREAAQEREAARILAAIRQDEEQRVQRLTIVCKNGGIIRPIK